MRQVRLGIGAKEGAIRENEEGVIGGNAEGAILE
jgi:hypothetical protein